MRKIILPLLVMALLFPALSGNAGAQSQMSIKAVQELSNAAKPNFFAIKKAYEDYYNSTPAESRQGFKQYKRWENFWVNRVNQNGEFPGPLAMIEEYKKVVENLFNF